MNRDFSSFMYRHEFQSIWKNPIQKNSHIKEENTEI